jgi:AhpD family alkylhydroperoxidase
MAAPDRSPRTFASAREAAADVLGVARRARPLLGTYARGDLDPALRERVMVAVSRVNACRGCTYVHERWAGRAGVSAADLEAIGLGDLDQLGERDRVAVAYAAALAQARFRRPVDPELRAAAGEHLTPRELAAVEAVARAMAVANLSVNTTDELLDRCPVRTRRRRSRRVSRRPSTTR